MTDVQNRLMTMLNEISHICRKKNLRFVLAERTAGYAEKYHKFISNEYQLYILMPIRDIYILMDYVNKNLSETREFESWENNCKMREMVFRYVDKTSTLIDGYNVDYFSKPGIAVTITPVTEGEGSTELKGCQRYLQLLNKSVYKDKCPWVSLTLFKFASKLVGTKILSILFRRNIGSFISCSSGIHYGGLKARKMSRQELANWVVKKNKSLKNSKKASEQLFWYIDRKNKTNNLPPDFFTCIRETEFEGGMYPVYSDLETYYRIIFSGSEKWEEMSLAELPESDRVRMICDCNIPYREYLEYIKDDPVSLDELFTRRREFNKWMRSGYFPAEKKVNHTFLRVKRSVDRIDLWCKLRGSREEIRIAYENKDIDRLNKLLREYMNKTEEYRLEKIGFYIDDELFACAKLVWDTEEQAKKAELEAHELQRKEALEAKFGPKEEPEVKKKKEITYAESVYALVPKLYKRESVDEYFRKRNKETV